MELQEHEDHREKEEGNTRLLLSSSSRLCEERRARKRERRRGRLLFETSNESDRQSPSDNQEHPYPIRRLNHQWVRCL